MSNFLDLFSTSRKSKKISITRLVKGDSFLFPDGSPLENNYLNTYILVISLYCNHCIELLPYLERVKSKSIYNFILATDGNSEENFEISSHFNFPFPIIYFGEVEYELFGISKTPFILSIDANNKIMDAKCITGYSEVEMVLNLN